MDIRLGGEFVRGMRGVAGVTLILTGFWLLLLPMFAYWLWLDLKIWPWDMSIHSLLAYEAWGALSGGRIFELFRLSNYYPPLFHWIAGPLTIFGSAPDVYCAANWGVLLAAMIGTAKLGRAVAGEAAGMAAGLLLPAYIYITWMCRMPMTDLTLTATVVWTLWLLARGRPLADPAQRHGLGILIGLGMLAKWPYLFFTAGPALLYFYREWRRMRAAGSGMRLRWIAPAALWPVGMAGLWYAQAVPNLIRQTGRHFVELGPMKGDPAGFGLQSISYYPRFLHLEYLTLPLLLLLAGGIGWLAMSARRRGRDYWYAWGTPLVALGVGYLILTAIGSKDSRYVMPLVPVLAVISTAWVSGIEKRGERRAAIAAIAIGSMATVGWNLFVYHPPDQREQKLEAAAEWLVAHKAGEKFRVGVLANDWSFNAAAVNYALVRRDGESRAWRVKERADEEGFKYFRYVVAIDPPPAANALDAHGEANARWMASNANWEVVESYEQGDQTRLLIYERRGDGESLRP